MSRSKTTTKAGKKIKLTSRGRYAVMAMVELAQRQANDPVKLIEIAEDTDISLSYLEQLFSALRRNGLVKSYRGPGGGYSLAREPSDIRISEILDSAEDSISAKRILKNANEFSNQQTRVLWGHIGEILYVCMKHISLEDVLHERLESHPTINKLFENFG